MDNQPDNQPRNQHKEKGLKEKDVDEKDGNEKDKITVGFASELFFGSIKNQIEPMKPRAKTAEELRIIRAFNQWLHAVAAAYLGGNLIVNPNLKDRTSPALAEIRKTTDALLKANQAASAKPTLKAAQRTRKTLRHADTRYG